MEREKLEKQLGLTKAQIDGVMKIYNADIDPLKADLETANDNVKNSKDIIAERDKQLNELKSQNSDNQKLQDTIDKLQKDNVTKADEYKSQLASIQKSNAIKLALRDSKAKDTDMVFGSLDLDTIKVDDGKIIGLDEQLNEFKKSHEYMFDSEKPAVDPIHATVNGNPSGDNGSSLSLVQKIADRMAGKD